ncbi:hypothetical protein FHS26_006914 [Rhizobium pisi]|jgi:hypothetical protein|uniref:Uncharacterized protein n=1 Tax=Rhizobium pisi TaxID=574561 RepID=A0A427M538_9HYPH|nr:hypothetical protein [Rhizobium pisi]MBB3139128.1 hypothetical protein [Rhizobium pisi]RSB58846.1 hypothetical protein EFD55_32925 [Rhizobium pisi]TCA39285.1 hypothetical protein E0J16_35135 [Rhizobium pisi]
MKKAHSKPGLPLSVPFEIPTTWTPEQAIAVFDMLTEIRDRIWDQYNVQIQTELQSQLSCDDHQ